MFRCPFDGYRVVEIGDGLYKCMYCNNYLREKDGVLVPYAMRSFPYDDEVRRSLEVVGVGKRKEEEVGGVELPVDPEFEEFLRNASRYGAPASIKEFQSLSAADKQYYLKAYPIYLREKEKLIKKEGA